MTFLLSPDSRETHVTRIFGTNRNQEVLSDMYVDMERLDKAQLRISGDGLVKSALKDPISSLIGQGFVHSFHWRDDPSQDDYLENGNPNKFETELLKLCDPKVRDQNFDDPERWIPLRVTKKIRTLNSRDNYQKLIEKFLNDELNVSRKIEYRRVYKYDTNIDDLVNAAADADPTLKAWVINLAGENKTQYEIDSETKDDGHYIEYAVIKQLGHEDVNDVGRINSINGRIIKMLNEYLIDMTEEAKLMETGLRGINPPYILDPWQNIVNINWGNGAVHFYDKEGGPTR